MTIIGIVVYLIEEIIEEVIFFLVELLLLKPILESSKTIEIENEQPIRIDDMGDKIKLITFRCPVLHMETLCIYYDQNTNLISFEKNVSKGEMERLQAQGYVDKGVHLEKFCFDFTLEQAEQISFVLKKFIELNSK